MMSEKQSPKGVAPECYMPQACIPQDVFVFGGSTPSPTVPVAPPFPNASAPQQEGLFVFGLPEKVPPFSARPNGSTPRGSAADIPVPETARGLAQPVFCFGVNADSSVASLGAGVASSAVPGLTREAEVPMFSFGIETDSGIATSTGAAVASSATPAWVAETGRRGNRVKHRGGGRRHCATATGAFPTFQIKPPVDATPDEAGAGSPVEPPLTPAATPKLDFIAQTKLQEAQMHAREQNFSEAIEACLPVLSGPSRAVEVLRGVCESWQKVERGRFSEHEDEKRSLTAMLMAAKERSDALRQLKEEKDMQLRIERERREEAEQQAVWLRRRSQLYEEAQRENSRLKQDLREARRAPQTFPREELARQMAELECSPLRFCSSADRVAMKKKLLLKWHPDKQASSEHATLATQVMQELQNRPEWD